MIRGRRKGGGAKALAALLILIAVAPLALAPLHGPLLPPTRQVTLLDGATVVPSRPISNGQVSRGFPTHGAVNPATGGSGLVSSRGLAPGPDRAILSSPPTGLHFDYIVVLIMENHGICDILTTCGGGAPYMTSLANASGLATSYLDISDPSLPNYLGLTAATDSGCGGYDGLPHSNACTNLAWNATNLVDRFEGAGLTWKAYMEAMPANCTGSDSGTYLTRHNPFVYYKDIVNDPNRCDRDVPAGTSDATFLADLNSTANASNYMWLSPDKCNDMHSCSVAHGDGYLATLVPKILSSPIFTTQRAALYITYDEDGTSNAPHLYTVWAGPTAKPAYNSSAAYNHYSFVATLEANWNLSPLTLNDSAATPMNEFFIPGPTARFDVSPTWPAVNRAITFNGSASSAGGSNSTLQFRWDWTHDGVWDTSWSPTPTAQHAYGAAGLYTAALEVKDSIGSTNTTTRPVPVDGLPPTTIADLTGPPGLAGWFTGNMTVSLAATDDLSGVARTNDSVDGGAWQPYAAPVAVTGEGNHTLRFFSVDNATNQEATHTQAFEIDSVAPVTTPAFAGTVVGNVFVTPINVTLSATDSGSGVSVTRYRVDGGPFTNYSGTFTVSNVGSHNVSFGSTDVAGNAEPTNSFVVVDGVITGAVGLTSQATLGGTPGSSGWYVSSVSVNLTLVVGTSPPDSIFYRLDGGAWTLYSSPFFVMGDGVHGLDFNATNNAGLNEAVHHAAIPIDTTAPQTTAALSGTPGANGWYISTLTVNLTATDAMSGVAGISYRTDGGPWTPYSMPFAVVDGYHLIEYYATDVAGNAEGAHSRSVRVDTLPPTTVAAFQGTLGNSGWYRSAVTAWLNASDAASGVASITYRVDNGSWWTYSGPLSFGEGRHLLEFYATDLAGLAEAHHMASLSIDTTPPATTASPSGSPGNNGWYVSAVTVNLAATDATSGVAAISYRIDGGPWTTYLGAFAIGDGVHTVEYFAMDVAGNTETSHSVTVSVDTTPPASASNASGSQGANGWYVSTVTVTLSATDAASGVSSIAYRIDSGAWTTYSAPFVLSDGQHLVQFHATDVAGNVESLRSLTVSVDTTPPITSATLSGVLGNGGWYVTNVTVALAATDATSGVASISYRIDGGPWTTYAGSFVIGDGVHSIGYFATDVAGNSETMHAISVSVDTHPPTASSVVSGTPGLNGWYASNVSVSLSAVDPLSGVASIRYRVDGGSWTTYSGPFVLLDGQHLVEYDATDVAGNVEALQSLTVPVDTVPPTTTATLDGTLGNAGWYTTNVTVTLAASDATSGVAGISFRIDGGPWTTFAGSFAIGDGVHALEYFATDVAGNGEATHAVTVFVDSSPPTTNSNVSGTQGNNGWYASNAMVSLSSTDAVSGVASITYRVDNGSWSAYSGVFELSEGRHHVDYFATDIAGNQEAPQGRSVSIDTTPPTTTLTLNGTLGADGWYTSNVTVAFAASDATSGVAMILYQVDGGAWQTYAYPFLLGDGPHTLAYYAIDVAGVAEAIRSPTVKVDATPPTTDASLAGTVGSNGWYVSNVTVTLTSTDGGSGVANVSWRVDGGAWQAYVSPFMLSEGRHSLEYRATDIAGNVEPIESVNVWIDSTPPASSASLSGTAGNDGWYVSFVTVTLSGTDALSGVSNISFRIDGGAWAPYAGPLTLGDGVHTVDYQARDIAGNLEAVHSASVSIDTQPPTTTITLAGSLGANGWYVSNVTASLGATDPMSGVDAISYRIDNGSWQIYAVPILLGEGRHFVEYYATDLAGNSEAHQTRAVSIDTTAPVTSFAVSGTSGNGGWYVSNVSLALNATDAMSGVAGLSVRVDNGSWTDYSSPLPLGAGRHRVEFFATDVAGIPSPVESVDVNVDTAAPSSTITVTGTLGDSGWYVSDATVTLSAIDDLSGVSGVLYRVDGGAWQAYTAPLVLSDGRHVIEAYATDVAGNVEPLRSASVAIDTSPPSTATSVLGTMGNVGWFISNATVSLPSTDAISGVATISYRLDGGAWTIYTGPLTLGDGRHALQYRASDLAGNVEMVHAATFSIDTTPPVTTHTLSGTAGANGWYTSDASVTLAATDAVSGAWTTRYRLDGGSWTEYTGPISAAGSGRHVLDFASVDVAGNLEEVHVLVVNIDLTDPSFASLTAAQGSSPSAIRVSWTAFDNESAILAYFLSVDGTPYESVGTATTAFLNLTAGAHVIRVQATDGAGRTAVAQVSVTVEEAGLFSRFSALVPLALVGVGFVILGYAVSRLVRNRRKRP